MSPHEAHGLPWQQLLLPQIVNFTIFVVLLVVLLRKPLKAHFSGKSDEFETLKKKADQARREAEKKNFEVHQLMKQHDETADKALADAQREAQTLKEKLVSEARSAAAKSTDEASKMAQFEWQRAVTTLQTELILNATKQAEKNLTAEVGDAAQTHLNDSIIQKLQSAPTARGAV